MKYLSKFKMIFVVILLFIFIGIKSIEASSEKVFNSEILDSINHEKIVATSSQTNIAVKEYNLNLKENKFYLTLEVNNYFIQLLDYCPELIETDYEILLSITDNHNDGNSFVTLIEEIKLINNKNIYNLVFDLSDEKINETYWYEDYLSFINNEKEIIMLGISYKQKDSNLSFKTDFSYLIWEEE